MAKLKYHKTLKSFHYYQRAIPLALRDKAKAMGVPHPFVRSTGLDQYAPLSKVEEALAHWGSVYDDVITLLERSATEEIQGEQRARLVASYLEARGYSPGQFASASDVDDADEALWSTLEELFGDDIHQDHPQFKGSPEHSKEFIKTAVGLLASPAPAKRITFSEAMNAYLSMRQRKTGGDRLKKEISYCHRFVSTIGDHLLTTENAGRYLKEYRNILLQEYKPPTVARMLSAPKAALNYAADTLCTDVFIPQVKVAGSTQTAERYTLSEQEVVQLIDLVTTPEYVIPDYVRLYYLVALHAGAHMREVRQTLTSDIQPWGHEGKLCVRIRGTKTASRERVVPLLPEIIPYIQRYMPAGEGSLLNEAGDVTDPAIDKQLTKPMKSVNQAATVYSLRHACRSLAIAYSVPSAIQQALMGWSDGAEGAHQRRYGLSGRAYEEQMTVKEEALSRMLQRITKMLGAKRP